MEIVNVSAPLVPEYCRVARESFLAAFFDVNTPENMAMYSDTAFSLPVLEAEIRNPDSRVFLVRAGKVSTGYMKLNFAGAQTDLNDPRSVEVERIYALAPFQGMGVGKMLMNHAIQIARARGADYLWLGVWEHNRKAIAFYEKNGFVAFSSHGFMLGNDPQTDILMRLSL